MTNPAQTACQGRVFKQEQGELKVEDSVEDRTGVLRAAEAMEWGSTVRKKREERELRAKGPGKAALPR